MSLSNKNKAIRAKLRKRWLSEWLRVYRGACRNNSPIFPPNNRRGGQRRNRKKKRRINRPFRRRFRRRARISRGNRLRERGTMRAQDRGSDYLRTNLWAPPGHRATRANPVLKTPISW